MSSDSQTVTAGERADLLATLANHRYFLRFTVRDLTDEQAALRPTASELCLGGLIKHVAEAESNWVDFIVGGAAAMSHGSEEWNAEWNAEDWLAKFAMLPGETLTGLLERYEQVARRTDEVVATLVDLDDSPAHHRRNSPARRARRHHPRDHRRRQEHGIGRCPPAPERNEC